MITAIVQARMGSERLPGKVLKNILDKPIIIHVLDRLSKCSEIDTVILATSTDTSNDTLATTVESAGYSVFRGSEDDVLERYIKAAEQNNTETIVRVTGDCPLIDPAIVDKVITHHNSAQCDYTRLDVPDTFIRGFDVEVVSYAALKEVAETAVESKYREHVTYYIYTHQDQFSIEIVKGESLYAKSYRLCVDTQQDFNVVQTVFSHFNDPFCNACDIVKFLDKNPHIAQLNIETSQKEVT